LKIAGFIGFVLMILVAACSTDSRHNTRIPALPDMDDSRRILAGIEFLNDAIKSNASSSQNYFKRAELYVQQKNWSMALDDLNESLNISPNNGGYLFSRAYVLQKLKRYDQALADARRAEVLGQDTPQLYTLLGMLSQQKRNYRDAKLYLAKALQMAPYEGEAYLYNGTLAAREGDTASAIAYMQRSLELKPRFLETYFELTGIYTKLKSFNEAFYYNNTGIKYFPKESSLQYSRGVLYHTIHRLDSALIFYKNAALLDTTNYLADYQAGTIYLKWRIYALAMRSFAKVARQNPKFPQINFLLGTTFEKLGNLDKAIEQYTIATQIDPANWRAKGRLYVVQKRKSYFDMYGFYPNEHVDSSASIESSISEQSEIDTTRIRINVLQPKLEINTKNEISTKKIDTLKVNKPVFEPIIRPRKRG